MRGLLFLYRYTSIAFLVWVATGTIVFPVYVTHMSHSAAWKNTKHKAQAIVVFTGDRNRLNKAHAFFNHTITPKMHISGVGWRRPCSMHRRISWDNARNTWENIIHTKQWMQAKNIRCIYLMTSDYHMPRSLLLSALLWKNVTVFPNAISSNDHLSMTQLWSEYVKCWGSVALWIRHILTGKIDSA